MAQHDRVAPLADGDIPLGQAHVYRLIDEPLLQQLPEAWSTAYPSLDVPAVAILCW